jgi:hypothetical protein
MGIVRMTSETIRQGGSYNGGATDAWASLDAAFEILCRVADRLEDSDTMLADEVSHGDY